MSQYGIFRAIFMSFYSRKLYKDVATNWGGKAFLYLLILVMLSWIVLTFKIQSSLSTFYTEQSNAYVNQIPVMTIKDGHVITPENRPYPIVDPKSHEVIAMIDTSGQYTTLEQAKTDFLITETKMISHSKENEIRIYNVPTSYSGDIIPQEINGALKKFIGFLWIPIFISLVIMTYLYRILQSLIYGLLGMMFTKMQGARLVYTQLVQIAMIALTPAIVIATILDSCQVSLPFQLLMYFILEMAYLIFGIASNKE